MATTMVGKRDLLGCLSSPTVRIVVGEGSTSTFFYIHKDLLVARSGFFAKAVKHHTAEGGSRKPNQSDGALVGNGSWLERNSGTIAMPDDAPKTFQLYAHLLYKGSLPIREEAQDNIGRAVYSEQRELASLYVFCEKIQDIEGKRTLMTAMVESTKLVRADGKQYYAAPEAILIVYNGTAPSDAMRKFLVKCAVVEGKEGWIREDATRHHIEYLRDLASSLLKYRRLKRSSTDLNIEDAALFCSNIQTIDEVASTTDEGVPTSAQQVDGTTSRPNQN